MWSNILTLALQLVGFVLKKKAIDEETERRWLELAEFLQNKKLVSSGVRFSREGRLKQLRAKRDANKA